jgi:hypothetical protein
VYILWLCPSHVPTHNMVCIYMYKNHILSLISIAGLHFTAEDVPWPPIHQIPQPLRNWLYDSVNVIAIKVAQSDQKGPISIYGTVLARDEYDYRCVYLFKRGRDDPQLITRKVRIQFIPQNLVVAKFWPGKNPSQTLNIGSQELIPIFGCKLQLYSSLVP